MKYSAPIRRGAIRTGPKRAVRVSKQRRIIFSLFHFLAEPRPQGSVTNATSRGSERLFAYLARTPVAPILRSSFHHVGGPGVQPVGWPLVQIPNNRFGHAKRAQVNVRGL